MSDDFLHDHLRSARLQAHRSPWTMPDQALQFGSAHEIPAALADSGNQWLSPQSQGIHGHQLDTSTLRDHRFFIVEHRSPQPAQRPDEFTVNWASRPPGGDHISIQRFDDVLPTRQAAVALATEAARAVPASSPASTTGPHLSGRAIEVAPQLTRTPARTQGVQ